MSSILYVDLKAPAPRRLALMRAAAATAEPAKTWRDVRAYRMDSYAAVFCTLSQGKNGGAAIWCARVDPGFRGERFADAIAPRAIEHLGWFTDTYASETARVTAEQEREYQERYAALADLESEIEDKAEDLRQLLALRNDKRFPNARRAAHGALSQLREKKAEADELRADLED